MTGGGVDRGRIACRNVRLAGIAILLWLTGLLVLRRLAVFVACVDTAGGGANEAQRNYGRRK